MRFFHARPSHFLHALWLVCLSACVWAAWFAMQQPWLGVALSPSAETVVVSRVSLDLQQAVPLGATVTRIASPAAMLDLRATDLIEDPDMFGTYPEMADFFARQGALAAILRSDRVRLSWRLDDGTRGVASIAPQKRPLADLPAVFWFQLFVGMVCFVVASWIFLLRPHDLSVRMFFVTGLMVNISAIPAAIYSTRELALPGEAFRVFSAINHAGAILFGCAFVVLFAVYPRRLVRPRSLLWLPLVFGAWLAADILRLAPDTNWGARVPSMLAIFLALLLAAAQWRGGQLLERAALRWFILSIMTACGLVTFNLFAPPMFGIAAPISQGYTFGFFLIMYLGLALGLRKYRLFDLDEWAYRVFVWVGGALLVICLDALLIYFGLGQKASLGLTLLLGGWLYFPLRQWLWRRIVDSHVPAFETLLPELSGIAFSAAAAEREARWDALLRHMFNPLEIAPCTPDGNAALVREEGLALYLPGCGGLPSRALRHARRGERLFSSRDALLADALLRLMNDIMAGREGYERGVEQERRRIGRDLHDNIGARLLKLIHHLRGSPGAEIARDAMKDLRTAIAAIDSLPVPLANALADWRAEAESRCEVAGVQLRWRQDEPLAELNLHPRVKATLESLLRETITNALKHAAPSHLDLQVGLNGDGLRLSVENDGQATDPAHWQEGYGLRSIHGRMNALGGKLAISGDISGACLVMEIPLGGLTT